MSRRTTGACLDEIEAVYRRDLAKLQRLATAVAGSRERGCDAVQDAFARAVQRRQEFRREGSLEGWLWRIVVTVARDAAAVSQSTQLPDDYPSENTESTGEGQAIRSVLAQLPERQRLVLFLRYYAELEYGSIAEAVGISPGTVGATLSQAREKLRHLLQEVPG